MRSLRRRLSVILALACSLPLVLGPTDARAFPTSIGPAQDSETEEATDDGDPQPADETATGGAEAGLASGRARLSAGDPEGAVETLSSALAEVDAGPETASLRSEIVFELVSAYEAAHAIDEDPTHLRRARVVLENYEGTLATSFPEPETQSAEARRVRERLAALAPPQAEQAEPTTTEPLPTRMGDLSKEQLQQMVDAMPPEDQARYRRYKGMSTAGFVLALVGGGLLGGGVGVAAAANQTEHSILRYEADYGPAPADWYQKHARQKRAALALLLISLPPLVAGFTLAGVGSKKARTTLQKHNPQLGWQVTPEGARFGLRVRI